MRKILIVTLLLALALAGCQQQSPDKSKKSTADRTIQPVKKPGIIGGSSKEIVKVYFANQKKEDAAYKDNDPESSAAYQFAFPISRTINSTPSTKYQDTINELLKGPTKLEKKQGYRSEIHNIKLVTLTTEKRTATVKFSGKKFYLDGDMSGPRVRAQIEKTLQQFSEIKKVEIYINSDPKFDNLSG